MGYKVYELPQFPEVKVLGALFTNITNIDQIKEGIISLNKQYDYCFVNANNLISLDQLNAAVYKTLVNYTYPGEKKKKLRANSINAEILLNLSPNANITDSLNKFGISKNSTSIVVLKLYGETESSKQRSERDYQEDYKNLQLIIEGEAVEEFCSESLVGISDLKQIKKNYKLGDAFIENDRKLLSQLLVGVIQLSDF